MDFAAIDFETAECRDGRSGEPWQLGVAFVSGGEVVDTKEFLFDVEGAPERAHGGGSLGTIQSSFESWAPFVEGRPLAAHNASCERTILTRAAPFTKWGPWTDTMRLAKARYPRLPSYALRDLCEMFGCVPRMEGRTWHDGVYDAVACAKLAMALAM